MSVWEECYPLRLPDVPYAEASPTKDPNNLVHDFVLGDVDAVTPPPVADCGEVGMKAGLPNGENEAEPPWMSVSFRQSPCGAKAMSASLPAGRTALVP